ncbi:MAG: hypothetical protein JW818_08480 [Pirellulales bacterium]|nr:hypothetical protein [Pirellulales bacterium]
MKELVLPILTGSNTYHPKEPVCPVCGERKVLEPHSMAILSAGALLMDRKTDSGGPSDDLNGFFGLTWHGAHDGGQGNDRDIYHAVRVMDDVRGGQGEIFFCSTQCLRKFLNRCVDELEKGISQEGQTSLQE